MASTLAAWTVLVWIISLFIMICYHELSLPSAVSGANSKSKSFRIKRQSSVLQCGNSQIAKLRPLIIGGAEANVGAFPWHAGLYFRKEENKNVSWVQMCGGSLITDKFVLTAAHCVYNFGELRKEKDVHVAVGKYVRSWDHNEKYQQKRNVSKIIHPYDYDKQLLHFDVALVQLEKKIFFGNFVIPVCTGLPQTARLIFNKKLFVAGWGLTENGQSSDHLLYTDLKFVPPNDCHKFIPDSSLLIEKFCTVKNNQSEVSVARQGDSGGGLTVVYEGQHYIVGIVSSAVNQVTMFTNISWPTHVRWIENEIRKHDSSYNWTDNKITESCPPSDTLVNNKSVCVGDIVFEDTFSGPLSDKWEHGIFFGNENKNWKFNVYTSDKNNSFTSNGSLVIRPTVYDDDFVTSGTLELKGCTETSSPEFCARTASPGRILPPIATAKIHTGNSFSFMYGELEIRAKLPIGDWLAPVLRLGSKDQYYGEGNSGFIDIAVSRGNSDLWCDGTDNGLGQVEFWVYMGPDNHLIYWNFDLNNVPENWYDHYHNFTVIWKPDTMDVPRPFVCDDCGKAYRWKHDLTRHTKAAHRNDRFMCRECGELFVRAETLRRHTMTLHRQQPPQPINPAYRPGNIALKIDNELVGELAPEGKTLCELFTALTKEDCLIYNKGSTFAPFDKEFYLSMSVAAGDTNYFKDGCLNRGKEKPWRNEEPEASLKFWQDKENWLPTWNEDRSSLYIDYVRVTAV